MIGLYHEHQRFDRDRDFQLVPSNLLSCGSYGGVVKRCSLKTDANLGEYNTMSVMQYGNEPRYAHHRP